MKKRKICILTQPLHFNYGGLLQAYALQKVLRNMGHDAKTDRGIQRPLSLKRKLAYFVKKMVYKYVLFQQSRIIYPDHLSFISQKTNKFIEDHIQVIDFLKFGNNIPMKIINLFDTFIVGSDQVWRPGYSQTDRYFLDFLKTDSTKRKIAYAASFGVSEWEFTAEQTANARELIKFFDAISLREDSGVDLCKKHLGADADHVLDPTLLLDKEEYIRLVEEDHTPVSAGSLMVYVLDSTQEKQEIVYTAAHQIGLTPIRVMPEKEDSTPKEHLDKCIYPAVTQWLRGFMDAEYVVTDSFHGTVFSILFNKPFVVIANKQRGAARFTSLLKIFSLEERLIYSKDELSPQLLSKSIDFKKVNLILEAERIKSISFLKHALE